VGCRSGPGPRTAGMIDRRGLSGLVGNLETVIRPRPLGWKTDSMFGRYAIVDDRELGLGMPATKPAKILLRIG